MLNYLLNLVLLFIFLISSCTEGGSDSSRAGYSEGQSLDTLDLSGLKAATFAGGCFWCTEAYFERLEGVKSVVSGYTGGTTQIPTYSEVSAGNSDHAEAVQVYYNPKEISFDELLEVFFSTHDPTTLNRQGPDIGKQYRSIAFYRTTEEKKIINEYIKVLNESGTYKSEIVTHIQPFNKFWKAEDYHQDYYRRNPADPYVVSVAKPKVLKFESNYHNKLKKQFIK
jgi:peptide-methionine (S)-S-oxide reductase